MARRKVSDYLVHLMATHPDVRDDTDIMSVLPIIMMKVACFKALDIDTVASIVRKGSHVLFQEDDVIIRQGDVGDAFFIILRGSVSIYVDPKLGEDKGDNPQQSDTNTATPSKKDTTEGKQPTKKGLGIKLKQEEKQDIDSSRHDSDRSEDIQKTHHHGDHKGEGQGHSLRRTSQVDVKSRKKYGALVTTLSRYQSFGELALLYPNKKRNASVVADEKTDLLVVSNETFQSTLKDLLETDLEEKRIFIQTHPFFGHWAPHLQRMLQWSLAKTSYKLGAHVINQGEHVLGLRFLVTGRARLAAEPRRHRQQFPLLFAGYDNNRTDRRPRLEREDSNLSEIVDEKRCSRAYRHLANIDPMTYIRRTDGYAAAEKVVFDKLVDICIIEEGEILCDCELLMGLDRNIFTVICSTSCTFYTLNTKMFDRLIYKKNPQTLKLMKLLAETKLSRRISSAQGRRIGVLSPLLFSILNIRVVDPNEKQQQQQDESAGRTSAHRLPILSHSQGVQQIKRSKTVLIDWFIQGRTPLLQPITKDAIYYRDMIQRRAKLREVERRRGPKEYVQVKSLERRIKEAFVNNIKESIKAKNTMKKLSLQRSELTQVSRWK